MRDPERIDRILGVIADEWKKNPDLRLMQLLTNACKLQYPHKNDFFYVEDEVLEDAISLIEEKLRGLDTL